MPLGAPRGILSYSRLIPVGTPLAILVESLLGIPIDTPGGIPVETAGKI